MAVLPKDRRGQIELVFTILAAAMLYFTWAGTPIGGVPGISALGKSRDSLNRRIDSLKTQVDNAKNVVRQGTVALARNEVERPDGGRERDREVGGEAEHPVLRPEAERRRDDPLPHLG